LNDPIPYPADLWDAVSPEAQDLVQKLLVKSPETRISIQDALAHPFIEKAEIHQLESLPTSQEILNNFRSFNAQ
jgi:serine/threonine protein kinase